MSSSSSSSDSSPSSLSSSSSSPFFFFEADEGRVGVRLRDRVEREGVFLFGDDDGDVALLFFDGVVVVIRKRLRRGGGCGFKKKVRRESSGKEKEGKRRRAPRSRAYILSERFKDATIISIYIIFQNLATFYTAGARISSDPSRASFSPSLSKHPLSLSLAIDFQLSFLSTMC